MGIPLLLLMMVLFAVMLGEARTRRPVLAPDTSFGLSVEDETEVPNDGLVDLPSPDAKPVYSERASQAEMTFAGQYLNLAGLSMLILGMLSYLRVSGITEKATSGGLLQCCLGLGLGVFLSWSGERMHRQGMRNYALPLLASGIVILTVTTGAAYFYFHLLPTVGLALATFAIVTWSGLVALRYDSPLIGGGMLAAMFLAPLGMRFPLDGAGVAMAYLLAINLAITLVAYHKKWDGFLIASLAGSYLLYFNQFGLEAPWSAMAFLAMTYALFLVSGNLFHFLRRTASDFNLGLSMVNPLLFACVSYLVLLKLPNAAALAIYTAVALIHAGLAAMAVKQRGQGEAYRQIAQGNLALAILFSTAAVSFLTYCSTTTSYFALVTFLWMVQGFVFLHLSGRLGEHFSPLVRRGSYGALALASIQLAYVVPTMEQPFWIEFVAMLALLVYFWQHEGLAQGTREQQLFSNLVLLSAITAGHNSFPMDLFSTPGLLAGGVLCLLAMVAYLRYPATLVAYRFLSPALATLVTTMAFCRLWPYNADSLCLVVLAALVGGLAPLCGDRPELATQRALAPLLATVLLLRCCLVMDRHGPGYGLILAVFIFFALYQISRSLERLDPAVRVLGLLLGLLALFAPALSMGDLLSLVLALATYGLVCRQAFLDSRWDLCAGSAVVAGLLAMRLALVLQSGPGGTLLWCLLGLGLLRYGQGLDRVALGVMFVAFLKSILFDANFTFGSRGLELAITAPDIGGLALVGAVIACFSLAARMTREQPEIRNYYSLFGLLIFAFQTTFLLFTIYGVLMTFQVILSVFWSTSSLLFVAYGIHRENKLFRLFGLVVLVSCVVKMYAVDIWVLDSYDKTTTTLALGSMLMVVSFLYQTNRDRLEQLCPA